MDATERRSAVLRAVVEEYIETAQPVGSQALARGAGLAVSSATIRHDMTVLEREGYLSQPHTSAGRIPTDHGYRYFVDHFAEARGLPSTQRRAVADFFASAHHALEDLLHETSVLLADLTDHASVVVGPGLEGAAYRSVRLVALQPNTVLVLAVRTNGAVQKELLRLEAEPSDAQLARAEALLADALTTLGGGPTPAIVPSDDTTVDALRRQVVDALAARVATNEPVFVGGASRLAAEDAAFSTTGSAARLLEMLEHQALVIGLVRDLLDTDVTVRIGEENRAAELRECSVVLAPYEIDGEVAGTVGVLGPTRMDYRQALAAVSAVSEQLGRALT